MAKTYKTKQILKEKETTNTETIEQDVEIKQTLEIKEKCNLKPLATDGKAKRVIIIKQNNNKNNSKARFILKDINSLRVVNK